MRYHVSFILDIPESFDKPSVDRYLDTLGRYVGTILVSEEEKKSLKFMRMEGTGRVRRKRVNKMLEKVETMIENKPVDEVKLSEWLKRHPRGRV